MVCRLALNIPSYVEEGTVRARPPRLAPLTREEFVSKKLAPKLQQQLKVPHLASCVVLLLQFPQHMQCLSCLAAVHCDDNSADLAVQISL